jgi:hypothetical protein
MGCAVTLVLWSASLATPLTGPSQRPFSASD